MNKSLWDLYAEAGSPFGDAIDTRVMTWAAIEIQRLRVGCPEWLVPFLRICDKHGIMDEMYAGLNEDGSLDSFYVNTNDCFAWGCADGEPIRSMDDVTALGKAIDDVVAIVGDNKSNFREATWGSVVYACRRRGMRLQGAAYPTDQRLWPLIDACGPEREIGIGNPLKPGENSGTCA